jgi:hypothetical protein
MNSIVKQSWLFLVVLAGSGCALTDMSLRPPEVPEMSRQCAGTRPLITLVTPFDDSRPQRQRCGMKKNGYNLDTANILCDGDPELYLANLLAAELDKAGFEVQRKAPSASSGGLHLEGQLLQFFVEPKVGGFTFTPEADIHVKLSAASASGLKAERDFYVKWEEVSLAGTESNFQTAADKATVLIVGNMAQAVQELIQRFPELKTRTSGDSTQAQPCS